MTGMTLGPVYNLRSAARVKRRRGIAAKKSIEAVPDFPCLFSYPHRFSAPATGADTIAVAFVYVVAVVKLSSAYLSSMIRFVVKFQTGT
jgi:hypothetical protein